MERRFFIGAIIIVLLITCLSFLPSLKNNFVNWDDDILVVKNPDIRQISWPQLKKVFTSYYAGTYIPFTILSFSVEYQFFKSEPYIYHFTNLILHLLNCLIVFLIIFVLTRNITVSFITAVLFGIHPLRVESVAWVTERKDVLYALFFLGSLLSYLYYLQRRKISYYYLSLILFIFSFLAKGMAMTLPFILLLVDRFRGRRFDKRLFLEKVPFFVIAVVSGIMAIIAQQTLRGHTFPFLKNILIAIYVFIFYIYKIIFPVQLYAFYPFPTGITNRLPPPFFITPIILVLLIWAVVYSRRYTNKIAFGGLFFAITILPVTQLIPVAGPEIAANRYTYIPSIGILFIAAYLLYQLLRNRLVSIRVITLMGFIAVAGYFSIRTYHRCGIWKDSITLWSEVLKNFPKSPHAYNQRGLGYLERERYIEAIDDFTRAININPDFVGSYNNRGIAYRALGRYGLAYNDFSDAVMLDSNFVDAYYNRGNLYMKIGEYDSAIDDYSRVIGIRPDYFDAYINRGNAYGRKGSYELAIEDYNRVLGRAPNNRQALYNRAVAYYYLERYKDALRDLQVLKDLGYSVDRDIIEMLKKHIDGSIE